MPEKFQVSIGIENTFPNPLELFDEDNQSQEELLEAMGKCRNIVPKAGTEMVLTDSLSYEENVVIETISGKEKESTECVNSSHEKNQNDGMYKGLAQFEDGFPIMSEGHNFSNSQRSIEKLRESTVALADSMDIDISCGPENGSPKLVGMDGEGHGFISLEMKSPEKRNRDDVRKDLQLTISLDGISYSEFPDFTGTKTPEFMVIPTPAKKERPRTSRKRKCIIDDHVVLTNEKLKQSIYDAGDLVVKRRKCPDSPLTAWKASQISDLSSGFLVPVMSCVSSELRSLLSGTRVNKSAEMTEFPHNFDDPSSTTFCMLEETDQPERNSKTGRYSNAPDVSGSITSNRSELVTNYMETVSEIPILERSCASETQVLDRVEGMEIAPGTPVRCSTSARPFESPESPKVPKLNVQIRSCEVDDRESDGWSGRTRMVAGYLLQNFANQKVQCLEGVVNLSHLLSDKTRRESATVFYEILVLKTKECVDVQQECAYGDILVWKLRNWDLSFGSHLSITYEDSV